MPRKPRLHQVRDPLQGVRVDQVLTLTRIDTGDPGIDRPVLAALNPNGVSAGVLEFDAVGWLPLWPNWAESLHQNLSRWVAQYGTANPEEYLDVRSGLDLDMSPAGLVQPGLLSFEVMGGPTLALHHFNGPWPLLRLTFTTQRPRKRGFVTLGTAEAAALRDLIAGWLGNWPAPN
ncbi:hypothetical protein ABT354_19945 [Streptomyces sp. NPDC000594]|uniref:hypothetical protein n=1 Tax=Streptomyces sp. NPDC000594 TaxID=3154261 RepID=UPI0033286943